MKQAEYDNNEVIAQERPWVLVTLVLALARPLTTLGIIFSGVVIIGYIDEIEALYRPIPDGPATHPLTAVCIMLLSLSLWGVNDKVRYAWLHRIMLLLTLLILSIRIVDAISGTDLNTSISPFQNQVLLDLQMGKSNSMGVNTALMLFVIAIALALYDFRLPNAAQFFAFAAAAIPTVTFTGYAYGLDKFYGQMSMITATLGLLLATATLAMTAKGGALRAILSPYIGGKIARLQTLAGYVVPLLLGFLIIKSVSSSGEGEIFGVYVVATCWFIILMVSVSAVFQEYADYQRRESERRLLHAAMNDQLTNIPNRRKFFEFAHHEISHVKRSMKSLWLMVLDIDHFKKINDNAGHAMGDRVLIEVSKLLKSSVRSFDLVSRIGGEEFAILLVETNRQGAERVAESIRSSVEKIAIEGWTDQYGPITVSIGCAPIDANRSLESMLVVADECLYRAKYNGRNRVEFSE